MRGTAAAAPAGLLLVGLLLVTGNGGVAAAAKPARCEEGRIVVVGAGLAGLTAADALRQHGCDVTVLEASPNLGASGRPDVGVRGAGAVVCTAGRAYTVTDGAFAGLDAGAHWVHGGAQNPIMAKLLEYVGAVPVLVGGDSVFEGGLENLHLHNSSGAVLEPQQLTDLMQLTRDYDTALRQTVQQSNRDISYENAGAHAAAAVGGMYSGTYGAAASAEALKWYQAVSAEEGAGAEEQLLSATAFIDTSYVKFNGADQVIRDGHAAISRVLATDLDIRYNTPVTQIVYTADDAVEVLTKTGSLRAAAVIVTVPLGVLQTGAVEFSPPLPDTKAEAVHALAMGPQIRVALKFAARFWPADKYLLGYMSEQRGEFPQFFAGSFEEQAANQDTVVAVLAGKYALALMGAGDAAAAAAAVKILRRMYAGVGNPVATTVHYWTEQTRFAGGARTYLPVDTSPQALRDLAAPMHDDRLLFAGEATCATMYGTTHGAVASGLREARRLVDDPASTFALFADGLPDYCERGAPPAPTRPAMPAAGPGVRASPPPPRGALRPPRAPPKPKGSGGNKKGVANPRWIGSGGWWLIVISCMLTLTGTGYCLAVEVSRHIRMYGWPKVIGGRGDGSEDGEEMQTRLIADEDQEEVDYFAEHDHDSAAVGLGRPPAPRYLPDYGDNPYTPTGGQGPYTVGNGRAQYPM